MNHIRSMNLLRLALTVDAISSAVMGLALVAGSKALAALTLVPHELLFGAGIALLPFALFVSFVATRANPPRVAVWAVIAVNALWVIESVTLLLSDWIAPNLLGSVFIAVQAFAVGAFAELQFIGLRKQRVVAA